MRNIGAMRINIYATMQASRELSHLFKVTWKALIFTLVASTMAGFFSEMFVVGGVTAFVLCAISLAYYNHKTAITRPEGAQPKGMVVRLLSHPPFIAMGFWVALSLCIWLTCIIAALFPPMWADGLWEPPYSEPMLTQSLIIIFLFALFSSPLLRLLPSYLSHRFSTDTITARQAWSLSRGKVLHTILSVTPMNLLQFVVLIYALIHLSALDAAYMMGVDMMQVYVEAVATTIVLAFLLLFSSLAYVHVLKQLAQQYVHLAGEPTSAATSASPLTKAVLAAAPLAFLWVSYGAHDAIVRTVNVTHTIVEDASILNMLSEIKAYGATQREQGKTNLEIVMTINQNGTLPFSGHGGLADIIPDASDIGSSKYCTGSVVAAVASEGYEATDVTIGDVVWCAKITCNGPLIDDVVMLTSSHHSYSTNWLQDSNGSQFFFDTPLTAGGYCDVKGQVTRTHQG